MQIIIFDLCCCCCFCCYGSFFFSIVATHKNVYVIVVCVHNMAIELIWKVDIQLVVGYNKKVVLCRIAVVIHRHQRTSTMRMHRCWLVAPAALARPLVMYHHRHGTISIKSDRYHPNKYYGFLVQLHHHHQRQAITIIVMELLEIVDDVVRQAVHHLPPTM